MIKTTKTNEFAATASSSLTAWIEQLITNLKSLAGILPTFKTEPTVHQWGQIVSQDAQELENSPAAIRADFHTVLRAVETDGLALRFADVALKGNVQIVQAAVASNPDAIAFAKPPARDNLWIALASLKRGTNLKHLSARLADQELVVLTAMKADPAALTYASELIHSMLNGRPLDVQLEILNTRATLNKNVRGF